MAIIATFTVLKVADNSALFLNIANGINFIFNKSKFDLVKYKLFNKDEENY